MVNDRIGSPIYAGDLAGVILSLFDNESFMYGGMSLYHYSNSGVASWYDFANAIKELSGFECNIGSIPAKDYPSPAIRPYYSVLSSNKSADQLNVEMPCLRDSLRICVQN